MLRYLARYDDTLYYRKCAARQFARISQDSRCVCIFHSANNARLCGRARSKKVLFNRDGFYHFDVNVDLNFVPIQNDALFLFSLFTRFFAPRDAKSRSAQIPAIARFFRRSHFNRASRSSTRVNRESRSHGRKLRRTAKLDNALTHGETHPGKRRGIRQNTQNRSFRTKKKPRRV